MRLSSPKVLIVTINYKGADSTARFVGSLSKLDSFDLAQVLVVENGSCDGSAEALRPIAAQFDNVELLESELNRGYFGGANWALQKYLASTDRPDWIIVCNNDIVFDDQQFLNKLLTRNPADVAVIAPAIIARLTGADCNPFLTNRPTAQQLRRMELWHSSYYFMWVKQLLSPHVRRLRRYIGSRRAIPQHDMPIYGAHGSFFIFSRSYFDAGGYIDDGHFLYAEELCIAEICFHLGLKVIHAPGLRVWHDAHRVTGRLLDRKMYEYAKSGLNYAIRKYFREDGLGKHVDAGKSQLSECVKSPGRSAATIDS